MFKSDVIPKQTELLGGKAKGLYDLVKLGVRVPPFCVFTHEEIHSSLNQKEKGLDISQVIDYLGQGKRFAVRSSAIGEDGSEKSFAGQFTSKLNVPESQLKEAVISVCSNTDSEHLRTYQGDDHFPVKMNVIVQECIESDISGVMFGVNPLTGNQDEIIINALYGLGEALVSGTFNSDQFTIQKEGEILSVIAEKKQAMRFFSNGGLGVENVPEELVSLPSLNTHQIHELISLHNQIKQTHHQPLDIEFCFYKERLYLLQLRPVTALKSGEYIIWDNSNIIESYPGITLPLTFSFIQPVYAAVYTQLCSVLGVSQNHIDENQYTFENMLGHLNGRVYYNLYSWYKLLSLLPGYSLNAAFMEKMMGVSERFELRDYKAPSGLRARLDILKMGFSLIKNSMQLPQMRKEFRNKFNEVNKGQSQYNLEQADAVACMQAYLNYEKVLTKHWKAPLVNDFFAMIYYGLFSKFCEKNLTQTALTANDFIGGSDVITTQPAEWQQEICKLIKSNPTYLNLFESSSNTDVLEFISTQPDEELSQKFRKYISVWGDRCFAELKLETITYRIQPELFISILKSALKSDVQARTSDTESQRKIPLSGFKKVIFNKLRNLAASTVSERENLRFERTIAFAHVRKIFRRIGTVFQISGVLKNEDDIFYLSKTEIFDFIKGTSVEPDLISVVERRKIVYEQFKKEPVQSPRIRTEGVVYQNNFGTSAVSAESDLKGIPCCRGIVKAQVKLMHSPDDIAEASGRIMVTSSTDPGWVSVFPLVSGILVERGSVLSHAAIVSREMSIPCIVGIKGVCDSLIDGEWIEMNGSTGEIKRLKDYEG